MGIHLMQPRFPLGRTYATPGARALDVNLSSYLRRPHWGDWGEELCAEDKQANEDALKYGTRLLSCYRTARGDRLYITRNPACSVRGASTKTNAWPGYRAGYRKGEPRDENNRTALCHGHGPAVAGMLITRRSATH